MNILRKLKRAEQLQLELFYTREFKNLNAEGNPYTNVPIRIGLDISTRNIGVCVLTNDGTAPEYCAVLEATSNDLKERLRVLTKTLDEVFKEIKVLRPTAEFQVIISTANRGLAGTAANKLALIEGMSGGIAFQHNFDVDWIPDSSWYALIGDIKDQRNYKKENTLKTFVQVVLGDKVKVPVHWESGKAVANIEGTGVVNDDIADAGMAALLYPEVIAHRDNKKEMTQRKNKRVFLRKEIRTLKERIEASSVEKEVNRLTKLLEKKQAQLGDLKETK